MRASEWIAVSYLTGLALLAPFVPVGWWRRLLVTGLAITAAGLVIGVAAIASPTGWLGLARDWAPAAYLMCGYWLPGVVQRPPNPRLESWFLAMDRRIVQRLSRGWPQSLWAANPHPRDRPTLEAVYVLVYPFVPACFLLLYTAAPRESFEAFWSAVLVAGYVCYGTLPWLPARPPRHLDASANVHGAGVHESGAQEARPPQGPGLAQETRPVRRLNEWISGSFGVGGNTFPSGHVAVASAAALVVAQFLPIVGVLLVLLTLVIAAATVVQRYHYAVDAVAGLGVGLLAWLVVMIGLR